MELSNPHFIGGFTDDGYCSEGMGYWNYGFGHYIMMGLAVRAATKGKLDIFQDESCCVSPSMRAATKSSLAAPPGSPMAAVVPAMTSGR